MKYALLSAKEIFAAWIRFRNMRLKRIVEMWAKSESFKTQPQMLTVNLTRRIGTCESSDYL